MKSKKLFAIVAVILLLILLVFKNSILNEAKISVLKSLKNCDGELLNESIIAIGNIGFEDKDIIAQIRSYLTNKDAITVIVAADALLKNNITERDIVSALKNVINKCEGQQDVYKEIKCDEIKVKAATALARVDSEVDYAVKTHISVLQRSCYKMDAIVPELGKIGPKAKEATPDIIKCADSLIEDLEWKISEYGEWGEGHVKKIESIKKETANALFSIEKKTYEKYNVEPKVQKNKD